MERAVESWRPPADAPDLARALRSCLGRFATGVCVITFAGEDGPRGLTLNSFTSVSMDPPLVLISIARTARAHAALVDRPFCVNVLGAEQQPLAQCFAGGPRQAIAWIEEPERAPRLPGVLAHLACRPYRAYEGGDHTLFLGEVAGFDYRHGEALGYHAGGYTSIGEPALGVEHLL